jgi:glycosyltransferase involved in cell wall biosynthesis
MYKNFSIAAVVPAHNEETQIGMVIETMPEYIDHIVVVDDESPDRTSEVVKEY